MHSVFCLFSESGEFLLRMERGEVVEAFENGWPGGSFLRFRQVRVDQKQAAVRRAGQAGESLVQRPWGWDGLCVLQDVREEQCGWNSRRSSEGDRRSLQIRPGQHPDLSWHLFCPFTEMSACPPVPYLLLLKSDTSTSELCLHPPFSAQRHLRTRTNQASRQICEQLQPASWRT